MTENEKEKRWYWKSIIRWQLLFWLGLAIALSSATVLHIIVLNRGGMGARVAALVPSLLGMTMMFIGIGAKSRAERPRRR